MLNRHEKLMRLQNSASHVVCQEKFSFIILSIDSSEQPYLYPRQLLLLRVQVCVMGYNQTQRAQDPHPVFGARIGLDAACSIYTSSVKCAGKIMFAKPCF